jgi:hypothetical protein
MWKQFPFLLNKIKLLGIRGYAKLFLKTLSKPYPNGKKIIIHSTHWVNKLKMCIQPYLKMYKKQYTQTTIVLTNFLVNPSRIN